MCGWIGIHVHPALVAKAAGVAFAIECLVSAIQLVAKAAPFNATSRSRVVTRRHIADLLAVGGFGLIVESIDSLANSTKSYIKFSRPLATG